MDKWEVLGKMLKQINERIDVLEDATLSKSKELVVVEEQKVETTLENFAKRWWMIDISVST